MIKGGQFDQHLRLRLVQVGVVLMLGLLAVSEPGVEEGSSAHEVIEALGFLLLVAGVGGRLWSILYIGAEE